MVNVKNVTQLNGNNTVLVAENGCISFEVKVTEEYELIRFIKSLNLPNIYLDGLSHLIDDYGIRKYSDGFDEGSNK